MDISDLIPARRALPAHPQWATTSHFRQLAVSNRHASVHNHMINPFRIMMRIAEGRGISDFLGIKDHDVGMGTGLDHATIFEPKRLRRE